ncbi:MAG TPA: NAD-dependent epimerase/dehydratase family protein [Actinomycetota bacterium]|nr:NAD-dependent epimerase/dehydratase family protein [Actinomycetota bacterium]
MSDRVLITGGAGFVGSHLCDAFVARGSTVVCLANAPNPVAGSPN